MRNKKLPGICYPKQSPFRQGYHDISKEKKEQPLAVIAVLPEEFYPSKTRSIEIPESSEHYVGGSGILGDVVTGGLGRIAKTAYKVFTYFDK